MRDNTLQMVYLTRNELKDLDNLFDFPMTNTTVTLKKVPSVFKFISSKGLDPERFIGKDVFYVHKINNDLWYIKEVER